MQESEAADVVAAAGEEVFAVLCAPDEVFEELCPEPAVDVVPFWGWIEPVEPVAVAEIDVEVLKDTFVEL